MTADESKLEILQRVADGTLSVEEGSDLIGILEGAAAAPEEPIDHQPSPPDDTNLDEPMPHVSGCWKAAWSMILVGGAVLTAFSAYWVYQGYQRSGLGWGFWLSWIPFIIGFLIMLLGWTLMESPWLHLRVNSKEHGKTTRINLVIPLPLKLASWVFKNFAQYMPAEVREKGIGEMIEEMETTLKKGQPFQLEVDDEEDGDQVTILITR